MYKCFSQICHMRQCLLSSVRLFVDMCGLHDGFQDVNMIIRASFCCSKKVIKLHLCAHLTAKDLSQPIFVCADLAKSRIDIFMNVIQTRQATFDTGVANIQELPRN